MFRLKSIFIMVGALSLLLVMGGVALGQEEIGAESEHIHEEVVEWICPMECEDLRFDEFEPCPVCGMDVVPHKVRRRASEDAAIYDDLEGGGFFDADELMGEAEVIAERPERALMPGVPNWLFYMSIGLLVIFTFLIFLLTGEPKKNMKKTSMRWEYPRFELTRSKLFENLVKWRGFQPLVQAPVVLVFVLVIVAGFIGSQDPSR